MKSKTTRPRASAAITPEGERYTAPGEHLAYVTESPPQAGAAVPLRPGIRWLRMPLPMALSHINLWLIERPDGWVLVDTGMATDATRDLWRQRSPELLAGKPLKLILITHFHPDHAGLAGWLQSQHDVPVWMSRDSHAALSEWLTQDPAIAASSTRTHFLAHGVVDPEELEVIAGAAAHRGRMIDGLPTVERFLDEGDVLDWGGPEWRVLATNGHATGHLCFADEEGGVIITGDQILPTISPNVSLYPNSSDQNPLQSYLSSLDRLGALDPGLLALPSHGIPFRGLQPRAMALKAHHADQLAKLEAACAAGSRSASDVLSVMFRRPLRAFDKMLGIGEALAHLEYLVAQRRAERAVTDAGLVTYMTALSSTADRGAVPRAT